MVISWLGISIVSYWFFSMSFFGDKLVLSETPRPRVYTFYVCILGLIAVLLIPFVGFSIPDIHSLLWVLLEAIAYVTGIYVMFYGLEKYDASRVMAAIGAIQPVVVLMLTWAFWGFQQFTPTIMASFTLLLLGSIIISWEKNIFAAGKYLLIVACAALLFAVDSVASKQVFLHQSFLQGLIWMRISAAVIALFFLTSTAFRTEIFKHHGSFNKKTTALFLGTQVSGGIAGLTQSFAVALAPVAFLPIINSLRGLQYIFLFFITSFFTLFFPHVLKEKMSLPILAKKIIAMVCIGIGLALLAFT